MVNDLYRDFINDVLAGKVANVETLIDEENCPELIKDLANSKETATGIKRKKIRMPTESPTRRMDTAYRRSPMAWGRAVSIRVCSVDKAARAIGKELTFIFLN